MKPSIEVWQLLIGIGILLIAPLSLFNNILPIFFIFPSVIFGSAIVAISIKEVFQYRTGICFKLKR